MYHEYLIKRLPSELIGIVENSGMVVSFRGCLGDIRCYGTVEYSGFGLCFERMVLFANGIYKMRDVIPVAKIPWKSVSLNVQRKTNAKFLSDTRGIHNDISSSEGMLMHRCKVP
nr:asparagine--tRNA ligase, cytoplasmic 1 [Tanacetum cinerariifolium]